MWPGYAENCTWTLQKQHYGQVNAVNMFSHRDHKKPVCTGANYLVVFVYPSWATESVLLLFYMPLQVWRMMRGVCSRLLQTSLLVFLSWVYWVFLLPSHFTRFFLCVCCLGRFLLIVFVSTDLVRIFGRFVLACSSADLFTFLNWLVWFWASPFFTSWELFIIYMLSIELFNCVSSFLNVCRCVQFFMTLLVLLLTVTQWWPHRSNTVTYIVCFLLWDNTKWKSSLTSEYTTRSCIPWDVVCEFSPLLSLTL